MHLECKRNEDVCLRLGVEPVVYTKAVRAASLPWNQRERHRGIEERASRVRPGSG